MVLPGVLGEDEGGCEVTEIAMRVDCDHHRCWKCVFVRWEHPTPAQDGIPEPICTAWRALGAENARLKTEFLNGDGDALRSDACTGREAAK